jgi:mRNA interferase RelE/StbE
LKKVKEQQVLDRVRAVIEEAERAKSPHDIANLKKIVGTANFYRIRVDEYRIGIVVDGDMIEFVRCLHRRDIYRYFP